MKIEKNSAEHLVLYVLDGMLDGYTSLQLLVECQRDDGIIRFRSILSRMRRAGLIIAHGEDVCICCGNPTFCWVITPLGKEVLSTIQ